MFALDTEQGKVKKPIKVNEACLGCQLASSASGKISSPLSTGPVLWLRELHVEQRRTLLSVLKYQTWMWIEKNMPSPLHVFVPSPQCSAGTWRHADTTHTNNRCSLHIITNPVLLFTNTCGSFESYRLKWNPCPAGEPLQWPHCVAAAGWRRPSGGQRWLADCLAVKLTRDSCDNEWPSWVCRQVSRHDLMSRLLSGQWCCCQMSTGYYHILSFQYQRTSQMWI